MADTLLTVGTTPSLSHHGGVQFCVMPTHRAKPRAASFHHAKLEGLRSGQSERHQPDRNHEFDGARQFGHCVGSVNDEKKELVTTGGSIERVVSNLPKRMTDCDVSFDGEGRDGQHRCVGGRLREQPGDDAGHLVERVPEGVPRAVNFEGHPCGESEGKRTINSTVEQFFGALDLMYN